MASLAEIVGGVCGEQCGASTGCNGNGIGDRWRAQRPADPCRRILDAARGVFADVGYERATIRGIAAAAGVDKSSVIQYFGTKQSLFREGVHWDIPIAGLTSDDAAETTENLARSMLAAGRPTRTVRWRCCCVPA